MGKKGCFCPIKNVKGIITKDSLRMSCRAEIWEMLFKIKRIDHPAVQKVRRRGPKKKYYLRRRGFRRTHWRSTTYAG